MKGGWLAKLPVLGPFSMQRVFPGSPTTLQSSQVACGSMNCSMETPGTLKINLRWRSMYFTSLSGSSSHSPKLATLIMWILRSRWKYSCTSWSQNFPTGKWENISSKMVILSQSNFHSHNVLTAINFNLFVRFLNSILNSVTSPTFYNIYIKLLTQSSPIDPYISSNPKFYPFFRGALGALDGTHISACPPASDRSCFHNHKSGVSQNVLTATTFNMQFCYILSGWEGSASDGWVFHDAWVHDLEIPDGKIYLADAGYPLCDVLGAIQRGSVSFANLQSTSLHPRPDIAGGLGVQMVSPTQPGLDKSATHVCRH